MDSASLTAALKDEARRLGFNLVGAAPAVEPEGIGRFHQWLDAGYAGQMHYLPDRAEAYRHPRHVLDGARSVLMLAISYNTDQGETDQDDTHQGRTDQRAVAAGQGRVARYAWGSVDYHDVIHQRLRSLADFLRRHEGDALVRGVVDTAPLLEREFAQLAGLGWIGKNTLLLNRQAGSWFFLAALLTDLTLQYDQPHAADHCGTCRACLDACPTDAFPQPYVLDATRCISYLTIELRGPIPNDLREGVGDWLFGCDVCQQVCPWNHRSGSQAEPSFRPQEEMNPVELAALFDLDDEAFRRRFRHTPLWRSKRRGILRNAAIVLGNRPAPRAVGALIKGLNDREPLVRAASAWALARYADDRAAEALRKRLSTETCDDVRREVEAACGRHAPTDDGES